MRRKEHVWVCSTFGCTALILMRTNFSERKVGPRRVGRGTITGISLQAQTLLYWNWRLCQMIAYLVANVGAGWHKVRTTPLLSSAFWRKATRGGGEAAVIKAATPTGIWNR